jgi:hypothetical protein
MIVCLVIHGIQNRWQIFRAPIVLERIFKVGWIHFYPPRLAIFPVCRIPSSLGPVDDRGHFRAPPWGYEDIGRKKIIMRENNGCPAANFNTAGTVKLFDSVLALEGTNKIWMAYEKYVV